MAVLLLAVAACGARDDDAADLTAEIVAGIDAGRCEAGPEWIDPPDWTTMCSAVRERMPAGARLVVEGTTSSPSGEIGYMYTSTVTFTDAAGDVRTLRLLYPGRGWSAARPELGYATLDGLVVFDANPRPS